jgi:hypothetical protein
MKRRTRRFWKRTGDRVEPDDSHLPTHVTVLGAHACEFELFLESRWRPRILGGADSAPLYCLLLSPSHLARPPSSLQVDTCVRVPFATVALITLLCRRPPADAYEGVGIPSPRERCSELPEVFTRRRPRSGRQDQNQDRSLQHIKTRRRSECHLQTTQSQS